VSARIFAENLGLEDLQIAQPIWFNSLQVASFHPLDPASIAGCRLDILNVDDASGKRRHTPRASIKELPVQCFFEDFMIQQETSRVLQSID
jgi:hypothetical protein